MAGNYSLITTVSTGGTILASDRNAEHQNHINNMTPSGVDDYSASNSQMQSTTDPYPASAESLATTLAGELERLRYVIKQIGGKSQWYIDPSYNLDQLLPLAGGTMTGAIAMSGAAINEAQGSDVASAGTINLDSATGNLVDVTGTTTITAITLSQGRDRTVRFTGALTLTHGASLVLPGSANITTAAGDYAVFRGYASSVVRCVMYSRIASEPLAFATQAQMETGSSNVVAVPPGRQHFHQSASKAWVQFDGTGTVTILASYNVTSITDNGTGDYTVNFTTAFSSENYCGAAMAQDTGGSQLFCTISSTAPTTSAYRVNTHTSSALADADRVGVVFFGDI